MQNMHIFLFYLLINCSAILSAPISTYKHRLLKRQTDVDVLVGETTDYPKINMNKHCTQITGHNSLLNITFCTLTPEQREAEFRKWLGDTIIQGAEGIFHSTSELAKFSFNHNIFEWAWHALTDPSHIVQYSMKEGHEYAEFDKGIAKSVAAMGIQTGELVQFVTHDAYQYLLECFADTGSDEDKFTACYLELMSEGFSTPQILNPSNSMQEAGAGFTLIASFLLTAPEDIIALTGAAADDVGAKMIMLTAEDPVEILVGETELDTTVGRKFKDQEEVDTVKEKLERGEMQLGPCEEKPTLQMVERRSVSLSPTCALEVMSTGNVLVKPEEITADTKITDSILMNELSTTLNLIKQDIKALDENPTVFHSDFEKNLYDDLKNQGLGEEERLSRQKQIFDHFSEAGLVQKDMDAYNQYVRFSHDAAETEMMFKKWPAWEVEGKKPVFRMTNFDRDTIDKLEPGKVLGIQDVKKVRNGHDERFISAARSGFSDLMRKADYEMVIYTDNGKWMAPLSLYGLREDEVVLVGKGYKYLGREKTTFKKRIRGQRIPQETESWRFYFEEVDEIESASFPNHVVDADTWEVLELEEGSVRGDFLDAEGVQWHCDFSVSEDFINNEYLSYLLYKESEVQVVETQIIHRDGRLGLATKLHFELSSQIGNIDISLPGLVQGFAVDCWLDNPNSLGLLQPSLLISEDGNAVRPAVSGSLLYKVDGTLKGESFANHVDQLDDWRELSSKDLKTEIFSQISDDQVRESVNQVAHISDDRISELVMEYGPGDQKTKLSLIETLINRKRDMIQDYLTGNSVE